jgi:hypothetical protein
MNDESSCEDMHADAELDRGRRELETKLLSLQIDFEKV